MTSTTSPQPPALLLPPVSTPAGGFVYAINTDELPGLLDLCRQVSNPCPPTDLPTCVARWFACPTALAWLFAAYPALGERAPSEVLGSADRWLRERLAEVDEAGAAFTANPIPATGSQNLRRRQTRRQRHHLASQWLASHPEIAAREDRFGAAILLLLAAAQPPRWQRRRAIHGVPPTRQRLPQLGPALWCRRQRTLHRGAEGDAVVTLARQALTATADLAPESAASALAGANGSETQGLGLDWSGILSALLEAARLRDRFQDQLETEKLASMKQLAYGASHEVNNPLANISTRAQGLLRDETDPERRQKLAAIVAQAFRAHDMISNLMLFGHPPEPVRDNVDVARWLVDQRAALESLVGNRSIELRLAVDEPFPSVRFDPSQVAVLLQALVQNAVEALRESGRIQVLAWSEIDAVARRYWILQVEDDGPGIPNEIRRHVFDPFYSGREAGRGLGFGLSKAWAITRLHGGQIDLSSTSPTGTQIRVILPSDGVALTPHVNEACDQESSCPSTPTAG